MTELFDGQYLYSAVKVGDRGQIVIPKDAREHFNIKAGDNLVVVGDLKKGIAITTAEIMKKLNRHHHHGKNNGHEKQLYGLVKCGESFQIVIPKDAREQFKIEPGDKLLVFGDINKGLALTKASILKDLALKVLGAVNDLPKNSKGGELD